MMSVYWAIGVTSVSLVVRFPVSLSHPVEDFLNSTLIL
jgi:hypothetical protein